MPNTHHIAFRSNRVRDIVEQMRHELLPLYGPGETAALTERLFEAFLGWDRVRLLLGKDDTVNQSDLLRFHWALHDLKQYRPVQHIVGYTDFCGCRIEVSPEVLIPRPETEQMVRWIVDNLTPKSATPQVADLCTGSGCIAIALKKAWPHATVNATDLSATALEVAARNAKNNGLHVAFAHDDVLHPTLPCAACDLMVSNPPYVRQSERPAMSRNVLDYEPHTALFVPDDDPLLFYRAIADLADTRLKPDGCLVVEINEALGEATMQMLHRHGFRSELHRDFRDRDRWIVATRVEK